ncbi:MAG TPA: type II toxin-antitoxin system VapC family toxin [Candidatus Nanoarchaeia archaeon]|nr:type II toxin-antitoxin system VapC family toxin [Candidatus Nanoarchaeia archaeon]
MYVLDSSILIDVLRKTERFKQLRKAFGTIPLITTSISAHELVVGARTDKQRFVLEHLLTGMRILPHDSGAAKQSGQIERELIHAGKSINTPDALIAGICRMHGAELITADTDFMRVHDLKVHLIK